MLSAGGYTSRERSHTPLSTDSPPATSHGTSRFVGRGRQQRAAARPADARSAAARKPAARSATRPPRSLRPGFVPAWAASVAVVFNAVNIVSTMIWQGRLHGALAATGYDEKRVSLLIRTNWIRTAALLTQAVIALYRVYRRDPVEAYHAFP